MRFRDYFKDHIWAIDGYILCVGLAAIIVWLDPQHRVKLATVWYAVLLVTLVAIAFFIAHFVRIRQFAARLQARQNAEDAALDWPLPGGQSGLEQVVSDTYNKILTLHRQQITALLAQHQDQKDFIDSWVHEIKVPLAAVSLLAESFEGQVPDDKLDNLNLQLDQIEFYVEQVLYYSRLDSFSKDYLLHNTQLKPLINDVVANQRNGFINKRLSFKLNGDDQTVLTDNKWLRFILTQLISNAVKYTPEGGRIQATIRDTGKETQLMIIDNGIGIPKDEQHRVFEKGFTGSNGRLSNHKSTGLGLFLAEKLAEKLGHHLTLTSVINQGTTVTIHFPYVSYYNDAGQTVEHPKKALHQTADTSDSSNQNE